MKIGIGLSVPEIAGRGTAVDPLAPGALTSFTWAGVAADNTPGFSGGLPAGGAPLAAAANDVLRIESSSGVLYVNYTLQAADIIAQEVTGTASADPLLDGSYSGFRARLERAGHLGPWLSVSNGPVVVDTGAVSFSTGEAANCDDDAQLAHTITTAPATTKAITGGADASHFEIVSGGSSNVSHTLRWLSNGTRDFDNPTDTGANNTYVVQVTATDGSGNAKSQTITITVVAVGAAVTWVAPSGTDWLAPSGTEWHAPSSA